MRDITTTVYYYDELSDKAKKKAIEECLYFNVDFDWWDSTYDDAENIGLKLTAFDLGRSMRCDGHFIGHAWETAQAILKDHGEACETYRTAQDYMVEYKRLEVEQCQEDADRLCVPGELAYYYQDEINTEDIDAEFLRSLLRDYWHMLQKEYEYLTSEEAIIEAIEANEIEFTENGERARVC